MEAAARHRRGSGNAGDGHGSCGHPRGRGRVAELAFTVSPPALQRAVGKARAGVEAAARDLSRARDSSNRRRSGVGGTGERPVAELAVVVQPPAAQSSIQKKRALVKDPSFDRGSGVDSGRRKLLSLADGDPGISRRHGDRLRRGLVLGQNADEHDDREDEEEVRLSLFLGAIRDRHGHPATMLDSRVMEGNQWEPRSATVESLRSDRG